MTKTTTRSAAARVETVRVFGVVDWNERRLGSLASRRFYAGAPRHLPKLVPLSPLVPTLVATPAVQALERAAEPVQPLVQAESLRGHGGLHVPATTLSVCMPSASATSAALMQFFMSCLFANTRMALLRMNGSLMMLWNSFAARSMRSLSRSPPRR